MQTAVSDFWLLACTQTNTEGELCRRQHNGVLRYRLATFHTIRPASQQIVAGMLLGITLTRGETVHSARQAAKLL